MRKMRMYAALLAASALGVGMIGVGVHAAFTDSASATEQIAVGTMGLTISSSTSGAVVTNTGPLNGGTHTVTYTCPTIQSSLTGSCPLDFKVGNAGSMPMTVSVASSDGFTGNFHDNFVNPGPEVIAPGGNFDYTGGIKWDALGNGDLGSTHSVTYTITATA